jgi:hypothetical protein
MSMSDPHRVVPDLVEYLIVSVPALASLGDLVPALVDLVERAAIRILDLIVLVKDDQGVVNALEPDAVESLGALREVATDVTFLSDRDIGWASMALRAGTVALVLVTEGRWAEPLSIAAQRAGGQIIAGERIPSARVESVLAEHDDDGRG